MSGFIAVAEAGPGQCVAVANSRFWPDIDLKVLREAMRIDATVTAARLLGAVTEAMASVNHELRGWRQQQQALGYAAAEEVPAEQIAGASIVLHRYLRAVGCRTKASLVERLRDFDTTAGGEKRAENQEQNIEELRRDALWAISDIAGRSRNTVDLI